MKKKMNRLGIFVAIILFLAFASYKISLGFRSATIESPKKEKTAEAKEGKKEAKTEPKISKIESVCLDAGHGGKDAGAVYKKTTESEINLVVIKKLKSLLEADGYQVFATREDDTFLYKRDRSRFCNKQKATIMVSVHHNSYDDSSVDYATVLFNKDIDKALASSILHSISEDLEIKSQGIAKFDNSQLYIATMPSILSEAFFITNDNEYGLIRKNDIRLEDEARAIFQGIKNYFAGSKDEEETVESSSLIIDRTDYDE